MALEVVPFAKKEELPISLPTPQELEKCGIGKLRGAICILLHDDTGEVTRYVDGLTYYEAIGVMEEIKLAILDEIAANDDED